MSKEELQLQAMINANRKLAASKQAGVVNTYAGPIIKVTTPSPGFAFMATAPKHGYISSLDSN